MRRNKLKLFAHFVWTTWDRQPWIYEGIERRLYREIEQEVRTLRCTVLAINSTATHVHLLVQLAATASISQLAKQVKGVSSYFYNTVLKPTVPFRWQAQYGAFTIGVNEVDQVKGYILSQKAHHRAGTLQPEWEEPCEELTAV